MKNKNCPFCNLHQRVEKENEHAIVLLSDPRKVPGHFLIVPKRHVEKAWEMKPKEVQDVFELVFFVQQKVIENLTDGCEIRQHYYPFLKQSKFKVDHVHYHVMPRSFEDAIYQKAGRFEGELFEDLTPEEASKMAEILK